MLCSVCHEEVINPATALCGCTFCHHHAFSSFECRDLPQRPIYTDDIIEGSVVHLPHSSLAAVVTKIEGNVLLVSTPQGRTRVLTSDVELSPFLSNLKSGDYVQLPSMDGPIGHPSAGKIISCHNDGMVAVEAEPEGYIWEGHIGLVQPYELWGQPPEFFFPKNGMNGKECDAFESGKDMSRKRPHPDKSGDTSATSSGLESTRLRHRWSSSARRLSLPSLGHESSGASTTADSPHSGNSGSRRLSGSIMNVDTTSDNHGTNDRNSINGPPRHNASNSNSGQSIIPSVIVMRNQTDNSEPASRTRTDDFRSLVGDIPWNMPVENTMPGPPASERSVSPQNPRFHPTVETTVSEVLMDVQVNVYPMGIRGQGNDSERTRSRPRRRNVPLRLGSNAIARALGAPNRTINQPIVVDLTHASTSIAASSAAALMQARGPSGSASSVKTLIQHARTVTNKEENIFEAGTIVTINFLKSMTGASFGFGRLQSKKEAWGIVRARRADGTYTVHFPESRNMHFRGEELERVPNACQEGDLVKVNPSSSHPRAGKLTAHAVGKLISVSYEGRCLVDFGNFHKEVQLIDEDKLWQCTLADLVKESRSEDEQTFLKPRCSSCTGPMGEVLKPDLSLITEDYNCGICGDVMAEPVTLGCGHSFCKHEIEQWFHSHDTCPICREKFPSLGASIREKIILRQFMQFPGNNGALFERKERVTLRGTHKLVLNQEIDRRIKEKYRPNKMYERMLAVFSDSVVTRIRSETEKCEIKSIMEPPTKSSSSTATHWSEGITELYKFGKQNTNRGLLESGMKEGELLTSQIYGKNMLMYASAASVEAVKDLISQKADIDLAVMDENHKKYGYSALSCAAEANRRDVVDFFLKRLDDSARKMKKFGVEWPYKLMIPTAVANALKNGHVDLALRLNKKLIPTDPDMVQCRRMVAMLAARNGSVLQLKQFITDANDRSVWERVEPGYWSSPGSHGSEGMDIDSQGNYYAERSLDKGLVKEPPPAFTTYPAPLEACTSKECVAYVLSKMSWHDAICLSPIHACAANLALDKLPEILDAYMDGGFDINMLDDQGRTALFYLWRSGKDDARARLELLLERGIDCSILDNNGCHVMHLAASRGDIGVFEAIMVRSRWAYDGFGQSPLHIASKCGKKGFVDHILGYHQPQWDLATECNRRDNNGKTAYALLPHDIRNSPVGEMLRSRTSKVESLDDGPPARRQRTDILSGSSESPPECAMQ